MADDKTVSDVMTESPKTVSPDDTLVDAAKAMAENDFGAIPVVDDDELKGILTDRDIVVRAVAKGKDPSEDQGRARSRPPTTWPRWSPTAASRTP